MRKPFGFLLEQIFRCEEFKRSPLFFFQAHPNEVYVTGPRLT